MARLYAVLITFAVAVFGASSSSDTDKPLPLVIWHGLGDSFDSDGMKWISEIAQKTNPGTYVYNIRLADDGNGDRQATFFGNFTEQLQQVCDDISSHPTLMNAPGLNAVGFSQGGQFLRGYVERCNNPPVKNLVTFGSQHNGIAEFQNCKPSDWLCNFAFGLLRSSVWSDFVQSGLVPAQYFRNPDQLQDYLEHSNFLADINNERKQKNPRYAKNMQSLDKFVMFVFENDTTVIPKETGWFAEVNGTSGKTTPLRDRRIYREDWIGLKQLDKNGALVFDSTPGNHMQLDEATLKHVFTTYFSAQSPMGRTRGGLDDVVEDGEWQPL